MGDTRYLKQRRRTWYSRVKVPVNLREAYGASEIVRSLHTRDLTVAQRRRWEHVTEAHATFERLQRDPGAMTEEDIQAEAWEVYQDTLRRAEAEGMDEAAIDDELFLLRDLLADRKMPELDEAKAWATIAALNGRVAALHGRLYQPPATFGPLKVNRVTLKPATVGPRVSRKAGEGALRFSEAASGYLEELQRDPNARIAHQTIKQTAVAHRLFADFSRDAALQDVTRAMASEFLATVAKLSPDWGRSKDARGMTLAELLDRYGGQGQGLSNRTLNRFASSCGAVFRWARRRGYHDGPNPFEGQRRKPPPDRKAGYVPFTDDELATLLGALRP